MAALPSLSPRHGSIRIPGRMTGPWRHNSHARRNRGTPPAPRREPRIGVAINLQRRISNAAVIFLPSKQPRRPQSILIFFLDPTVAPIENSRRCITDVFTMPH